MERDYKETQMKNKFLKGLVASVALAVSGFANADLISFQIGLDLYDEVDSSYNTSYNGNNRNAGYILDGGMDGFDHFGRFSNLYGLSLTRDVDVFQQLHTYRWIDTFTNNTQNDISASIEFFGNLGSDGSECRTITNFSLISHDRGCGTSSWDPIFGFVWGNNDWANANMSMSAISDNVRSTINLTLAAGESASIAHFATLQRDDADYYTDSFGRMWLNSGGELDNTNAENRTTQWAASQISSPYFDGVDANTVANIRNFNTVSVPEPSTLAIFALGIMGLASRKLKQQA
jgi:hypothetical protein